VFWSCGKVEALDGVVVVAGEVVFFAVALLASERARRSCPTSAKGINRSIQLGCGAAPSREGAY
jgi:hypothetical protein